MNEILEKTVLTPVTKKIVVNAPYVARKAQPGQFIILRVRENGERIPLTIADYDREKGTITLVFQEVGLTTRLLGRLEVNDSILDLVGPLGVPAELPEKGTVVAVGGGVGVAPILPKCKEMHKRGVKVISIIGARSKDLLILEEEMSACSDELHICTDDGSRGFHGFVSDKLKELIENGVQMDEVIAVGPIPMMRATCEVTRPYKIKTWVSMNPIMVDGTGMCGACRVTVGGETKFCCVDGPMFDGHLIDWQEAWRRVNMYRDEEKVANERCPNCGGVR
ncbi:MAG: sulfide/dihydroorotate dehydrogenase-like FAD/NAD-binding protein [Candidatus Fermentithermobacillus carboniphilus]|uniref:Sulfide/dihydroorotate dehydrogenase-like FAD/NAD-binding protein n=1 Tax=Candidatus Fermentithermobacillus carboniphilus TaxID=3085328 RepID=A0AAT9LCW6_9FIRM|nr:MAG: sulfide/dihydroorotate dehydrogenase-like FAD/NAD-binding protein [Candidatus Fermentithermobacillus carboniphilus]